MIVVGIDPHMKTHTAVALDVARVAASRADGGGDTTRARRAARLGARVGP